MTSDISSHNYSLLTDLYQLTMAQGYWSQDYAEKQASFSMTFRENPFGGGFTVVAGINQVIEIIERFGFCEEDRAYLGSLKTIDGTPLFDPLFLQYLTELTCSCSVEAMLEGEIAFPREPIIRVQGPIILCQLLETSLLNSVNFQSLVATKAARVVASAGDAGVSEFGLRRAQGPDGGVSASRAAYIGGCTSTSNVLAGKLFDIPVAGTNAHSWVMAFDSELEAFRAYARSMPHDCILLVDTYEVKEGVEHAIIVGNEMRDRGEELRGIRIDSGDIAYLSKWARARLDEAGLEQVKIVASSDLDEYVIDELRSQGACVDLWGVGTRLTTAYDQPALGGVYKLNAVKDADGSWSPRLKLSEQIAKMTLPGILNVRRYKNGDGSWAGDMIFDASDEATLADVIIDATDSTRRKNLSGLSAETLLQPLFIDGTFVGRRESAQEARERLRERMNELDPSIKRFVKPYEYPVGLERGLHDRQRALVARIRGHEE